MKKYLRLILWVIFISIGFVACRKEVSRSFRHHSFEKKKQVKSPSVSIKSKIQYLTIKEGDQQSKYSFIFGSLWAKDSTEIWISDTPKMFVFKNPICPGNILVVDKMNDKRFGISADNQGHFKMAVPPSTYELQFEQTGYNPLTLQNLTVNSGEEVRFFVTLGRADSISGPLNYIYKVAENRNIEDLNSTRD